VVSRFSRNYQKVLGHGQYHLAVAGGCRAAFLDGAYGVPTRYREVVLTVSKYLLRSYTGKNGVSLLTITCWQTPQNGRLMLRMRQSNSGR
jgi:hypothetical protein